MNVLYDHQAFSGHLYGGVGRYFFELMNQYHQNKALSFKLSLLFSNNEYLKEQAFIPHWSYAGAAQSRSINQFMSLLNRTYSSYCLKEQKFDVFHPTYYHKYFLDYLGSKPFVLTFHDATSERYAHQYPDVGDHLPELKKKLLQRADRIIAVSEFSKEEIQRFFGIQPDRIEVIHLGTSLGSHAPNGAGVGQSLPSPEPFQYLLYVGKRAYYKNFDGFFEAAQPIFKQYRDLHLICAGGGSFSQEEQMSFSRAGLANRVHYRPITDHSLLLLYQHALAFVFPSLNEGFGIPVLEAFSGGCPTLLSNRSSLPEVGGDAAVYFDPEDAESICEAVRCVIDDESLRTQLKQRGRERLTLFSCEKTANRTFSVYQSLLS
jgi:glycosyltransferase involved in cell wall biosynthesis